MPHMKSARIRDDIDDLAKKEADVMSRSLAQQLDCRGRVGEGMESAEVISDRTRLTCVASDLRRRERVFMKLGLVSQKAMYLIEPRLARAAKLTFPPDSALDAR